MLNFGNAPFAAPRQNYQQQQWQQYNARPRPFAAKPQPIPEPMYVDRSMQTINVNYINRPHFDAGKRPSGQIIDIKKGKEIIISKQWAWDSQVSK